MTPPVLLRLRRNTLYVAALALLGLALPACDTSDPITCPDGTNPVAGQSFGCVNFVDLFATATPAEAAEVVADFAARVTDGSYDVRGVTVVAQQTQADNSTVYVVSHTMRDITGQDFTNYGAIRVPQGANNFPVLVINHGGDRGFNLATEVTTVQSFGALAQATVQIWPVFRSEAIANAFGQTYTAGGQPSPWDRDVDDAITLLRATLSAFDAQTNSDRIGVLGYSRGGGVSLLMAQRPLPDGLQIDAVVDYFGPANFYEPNIQRLALGVLAGDPGALSLPGALYLRTAVLVPFGEGDLTLAQARKELAKRSAYLFTSRLPNTFVLHHYRDAVVPATQSVSIAQAAAGDPDIQVAFFGTPPTPETPVTAADAIYHSPLQCDGFAQSLPWLAARLLAPA